MLKREWWVGINIAPCPRRTELSPGRFSSPSKEINCEQQLLSINVSISTLSNLQFLVLVLPFDTYINVIMPAYRIGKKINALSIQSGPSHVTIVLFRLKQDTEKEQVQSFIATAKKLGGEVPGMPQRQCPGENTS
jgi:hypothetical protein